MQENERAAEMMTSLTGITWKWDGFRIVTTEPVFNQTNETLAEQLNDMQSKWAITWHMRTEHSDMPNARPRIYADVVSYHFNKLRMMHYEKQNTAAASPASWGKVIPMVSYAAQ